MSASVIDSKTMPNRRRDFSDFYPMLPPSFVNRAVRAIEAERGNVKERTYFDNYVVRLVDVLRGIVEFSAIGGILWLGEDLVGYDTVAIGNFFSQAAKDQTFSENTNRKHRHCINKVCRILVRASILPMAFSIRGSDSNKRAEADGNASSSKQLSAREESAAQPQSPFVVLSIDHRRSYDYCQFEALGNMFLRHLVSALTRAYAKLKKYQAKRQHEALMDFLHSLLQRKLSGENSGFFALLEGNAYWALSEPDWEVEFGLWRNLQRRATSTGIAHNLQTGSTRVQTLSKLLAYLADESILPTLNALGFSKAKARATVLRRTRRVLSQLPVVCSVPTIEMPEALTEALLRFFPEQSLFDEAQEFLNALYREVGPGRLALLTAQQAATMMYDLNAARLKALRLYFEEVFNKWFEHWNCGQRALALGELTGEEIIELVDSNRYTSSERWANAKRLFHRGKDPAVLGNILRYMLVRHDGIIADVFGRMHHLALSYGGKAALTAYVHPHPEAAVALWGLVMIDTFANAEVAREMPWRCVSKGTVPGYKKIDLGIKARGGYKRILDELPARHSDNRLTVPQAILMYKRMAKLMHGMAVEQKMSGKLMMEERERRINVLAESTARSRMTALLAKHPVFGEWSVLPSMIRPSALMNAERADEVQMPVANVFADHDSRNTTHRSYTGRAPSCISALEQIRDFQEQYQVVVIVSDISSAEILGLSEAEWNHLLSEAARTGMGVACRNGKAGVQPGTKVGEECHRMDRCSGCSERYVVATVENFADLVLVNDYVTERLQRVTGEGSAPVEAFETLAHLKAFSDAALAKASQSSVAAILEKGRELAKTRKSDYLQAILGGM
jgi:hypothetical protein